MANINSMPRFDLTGVNDISTRQPVVVEEAVPTHFPLLFLLTERGDTSNAYKVSGASAVAMYGQKSFIENGKFANHATSMFNTLTGAGNSVLVQRLKPSNAKVSTWRLWAEFIQEDLPVYQRGPDGKFVLDDGGNPQPTGATVAGHKVRWLKTAATDTDGNINFSQASSATGTLTNANNDDSVMVPILDYQAPDHGFYGDGIGARLSMPDTKMANGTDADQIERIGSALVRLQFGERASLNSSFAVTKTKAGSRYLDFSLLPGANDPALDQDMFADDVVLSAYQDMDGPVPQPGPVGDLYFYHDNIRFLLTELYQNESAQSVIDFPMTEEPAYYMNPMTGMHYTGVPYETVQVIDASNDGLELDGNTTIYAQGGSDGNISDVNFDALVAEQASNFGDMEVPYRDKLRYPVSVFYDSGFTLETKVKLFNMMSAGIIVIAGTQIAGMPPLTTEQDSSVAISLRSAARLFPESYIHGTQTCRAAIVGQAGKLIGSKNTSWLPCTFEIAHKMATYMSSGTGFWNTSRKPDVDPNNTVSVMRDITHTHKPYSARRQDWNNGMIYAQAADMKQYFYPALQTVYDSSDSVLNSLLNVFIVVDVERECIIAWRRLVGRTDLTPEQFLAQSDRLLNDAVSNKYDGRAQIVPRTIMTAADTANGFSWTTICDVGMSTMPLVNSIQINSDRIQEFL